MLLQKNIGLRRTFSPAPSAAALSSFLGGRGRL